jgi:uncharacterized protein (TIGR03083 family)
MVNMRPLRLHSRLLPRIHVLRILDVWLTLGMENSRFLECLAADYGRIRAVVPGNLDSLVPSCPEWTVGDLVQHVGAVYLHKVATLRDGAAPAEWPPAGLNDEEPVALLDRAYAELVGEFGRRKPEEFSPTWYEPDQSVGFWIRRMAQETVIHRIDAELGVGVPVAPIPDDLANDGIDELLKVFVAYDLKKWPDDYAEALAKSPGWSYTINTGGVEWTVGTSPGSFSVGGGPGMTVADFSNTDVTISGTPTALLRWVWNRETPGEPSGVTIEGHADLAEFRRCVVIATQ